MSIHRPLHLVDVAPPWQSGYVVRSQQLLLAQRQHGMPASAAVRPTVYTEPSYEHLGGGVARLVVDGVPYFRRTHSNALARARTRLARGLMQHGLRGGGRLGWRLDIPVDPWSGFVERVVERVKPSVLHVHMPAANFAGARAVARELGLPTVYEVRGFWEMDSPGLDPERRLQGYTRSEWQERETRAAMEADAVVTLGEAMREVLTSRGVPFGKIHIIGNGVDPERFARSLSRDEELARSLGLRGALVIGYTTSVRSYEGIETVLRTLPLLAHGPGRVVFVLVGDGPALDDLRRLARTLQVDNAVRFVGRVPHTEVRRYYSLFDVFVVPRTDHEVVRIVTPLKPLEAMALGIPTVVSDLPALRELVRPGERGWAFSPGDSADLARVLLEVHSRPDEASRRAQQARQWAIDERSWGRLAERTAQVYESL